MTHHFSLSDDAQERLALQADAAEQVRNSNALVALLGMGLRLGNLLNRGTAYANAKGFTMGSLHMLLGIRSSIDKSTLMDFLVSRLAEWAPAAAKLSEELSLVRSASKETFSVLLDGVNEMRLGASRIRSELEELPCPVVPPEIVEGSIQV